MLWIFIVLSILVMVVGIILAVEENDPTLFAAGVVLTLFFGFVLGAVLQSRHSTIYNNIAQIEVLEENNAELLAEIEPIVEKYLNYESGTLSNIKVDSNTIIAYSMYPELKGEEFVMRQIEIVQSNNNEIKRKKLALAGLESYRIWTFLGKPNMKKER